MNDNGVYNIGEGINNATLQIYSGICDNNSFSEQPVLINSETSGSWSVFESVDEDYCLELSAEGYENMSENIELGNTSLELDSMMLAELVQVGGQISYIDVDQFSLISDTVVLELIPTSEYTSDRISPEKTIVDGDWNGNWTATVEPGDWIIRACLLYTSPSPRD